MRNNEIEMIRSALDESSLSKDEKSYVLSSLWTQEQIGEICSQAQYDEFQAIYRKIEQELADEGVLPITDLQKYRASQKGILHLSYGARMIEWEERDKDFHAAMQMELEDEDDSEQKLMREYNAEDD